MRKLQRSSFAAVFGAAWLVLSGCSTTTSIRLSGTPGAGFSGHYLVGEASHELSGAVPLVIEVPGEALHECEFRKTDAHKTLILEIRHGKTQVVQGTAEPGALGVRAQDEGGWHFEIIR